MWEISTKINLLDLNRNQKGRQFENVQNCTLRYTYWNKRPSCETVSLDSTENCFRRKHQSVALSLEQLWPYQAQVNLFNQMVVHYNKLRTMVRGLIIQKLKLKPKKTRTKCQTFWNSVEAILYYSIPKTVPKLDTCTGKLDYDFIKTMMQRFTWFFCRSLGVTLNYNMRICQSCQCDSRKYKNQPPTSLTGR